MTSAVANSLFAIANRVESKARAREAMKRNGVRAGVVLQTIMKLMLHVCGFALLTVAGFTLSMIAGFAIAGISCFVLSWLFTGTEDDNSTPPPQLR